MVNCLMIATLLAVGCVWATEPPCQEEGCPNVTIYLGPRWGSKVIYPNFPKLRGPNQKEVQKVNVTLNDTQDQVELFAAAVDNDRRVPVPKQRPVPEDDVLTVDFFQDDHNLHTTRTVGDIPVGVQRSPFIFDLIMLDFTNKNLTGDGVKERLSQQSFNKLRNIRRLYLDNNNISFLPVLTFPVELEYGLVVLRLDNNPLYYLSSYTRFELSRLGNLKILSLANTRLYYLDSLYLPALEVLDLSGNHLSSVPPAFQRLTGLRHLDLGSNRISFVYGLDLSPLAQLRHLSLAANNMTYLWHDAFQSLYSLEQLYLNDNTLENAFQVYVPSDADVYLSGNPWKCDCHLLNLISGSAPRVIDRDNVTCVEGDGRSPRPVTSLDRYNCVEDGWYWVVVCAACVLFAVLIVRALRNTRREFPYTAFK